MKHFSINKILVPLDLSPVSSKIIANVNALAKKTQAKLHFVTVIEPPTPVFVEGSVGAPWLQDLLKEQEKSAALKLKKLVQSVKVPYQMEVIVGHVTTEINRLAFEKKADLVYLSGHSVLGSKVVRGGLSSFLIGSVSEAIALSSHSSVWVLREPKSIRKILLPLDGSKASLEALSAATYIAEMYRAKIQPVSVVEEYFVPSAAYLKSSIAIASQKNRIEERKQALEQQIPESPRGYFLPPLISFGEPREELQKIIEKEKPDLIIMSSHRKRTYSSFILGRTSSKLLKHSSTSMLLIHPTH